MTRNYYHLPFPGIDATTGFAYKDIPDEVLYRAINCAGTDLASAAAIWPTSTGTAIATKEIVITARYVDASNYAVKLPTINQDYQFTIFASATSFPSSGDVTVFLSGSDKFVDGTTSVVIPAGTGKLFRIIDLDSGNAVWGYR